MITKVDFKNFLALIFTALIINLVTLQAFADTAPDDWYVYNAASSTHSFSVRFPPDWQAQTLGNTLQGFSPYGVDNELYFSIREFENLTYAQVIDYYVSSSTIVTEIKDEVKQSKGEDLLTKKVTYKNHDLDQIYALTLIKRGSTIFALSHPNLEEGKNFPTPDEHQSTIQTIYDSFAFTDNWRQYVNYKENYTFIFPTNLDITNLNYGVKISNPSYLGGTLFTIIKYPDTTLNKVASAAENYGETLKDTEEINFHGYHNAIAAIYKDQQSGKDLSRIFVEKDGHSYGLTNLNIEDNFPHLNYYDQYLVEILESFEFFQTDNSFSPYSYFSDVRDNHPNSSAINALKKAEIIDGYEDSTFQPDGPVNRAELIKMVVTIFNTPDANEYKNCYNDVQEQWYAPYICFASEKGWVNGFDDGNFYPDKVVNRAEAMKIIFEGLLANKIDKTEKLANHSVVDVDLNDWYIDYYIFADNRHLLDRQHLVEVENGYEYRPYDNVTRKEVAESIYRSGSLLSKSS